MPQATEQTGPPALRTPGALAEGLRWYRLDRLGRIIAVDAGWDDFALANQGEGAVAAQVLGQRLSACITGDVTRQFFEAALQAVRVVGQPKCLHYRCDSAHVMRRFEMVLRPEPGGEMLVEHGLTAQGPQPQRLGSWPSRHPGAGPGARIGLLQCSQCLRVQRLDRADEPWQELHQFARRHRQAGALWVSDDVVCAECRALCATALGRPLPVRLASG